MCFISSLRLEFCSVHDTCRVAIARSYYLFIITVKTGHACADIWLAIKSMHRAVLV